MERSRKPPRIPCATTRHLKNENQFKSFKFSVHLSIHNTHFTLYTIHREKTLQLLYARPGCQVRGAHYILPREEHQRHHGHQLEEHKSVASHQLLHRFPNPLWNESPVENLFFTGSQSNISPACCIGRRAAAKSSLQAHI